MLLSRRCGTSEAAPCRGGCKHPERKGFHKDSPLPQLEPSKPGRKRCQGVTKNGAACTAWAMEGGLCYFHANPDKATELGRNGGRHRKHTYEQPTEQIARPESAVDVRRMLAEVMADIRAGKMDPKLGTKRSARRG